jgi:hypothetical protein
LFFSFGFLYVLALILSFFLVFLLCFSPFKNLHSPPKVSPCPLFFFFCFFLFHPLSSLSFVPPHVFIRGRGEGHLTPI